jgi:hypothetical protein
MTQPAPAALPPHQYNANGWAPELDALLAQYDRVKDEMDDAKKRMDALTLSIKAAATAILTQPDGQPYPKYEFNAPELRATVKLTWTLSDRFDTKGFRAANPDEAQRWTKTSGTWRLERQR